MAENFVNILREIRGNTLAPATDRNCIYGDIKWMHGVISGYQQITPAERLKLENIEEEATKNSTDGFLLSRANHTGTMSMAYTTDSSSRFAMTINDRNKLDAVSLDATKNDTDENLRDRATHTGTQSADTIVNGVTNAAFTNVEKVKLAVLDITKPPEHLHNMNEITLGDLDASRIAESSAQQFVSSAEKYRISGSEQAVNRGIPNGYAPLDGNGKINPSYLDTLNVIDIFTPVDFEAMLLLSSAQPGDIAYVQSFQDTYMLIGLPSNNHLNWKKLNSAAGVISINGLNGVVSMTSDELPEGLANKYFTEDRVIDRVKDFIKAGTNVTVSYNPATNELTISANDTSVEWSEIQNKPSPNISVEIAGDASGSANTTLTELASGSIEINNLTLKDTGTAGTYRKVTTDSKGRVISGEGATTIAEYEITDAYTKSEIDGLINNIDDGISDLVDEVALKAYAHNATLTGEPKAPTAAVGTNSTQLATTAFVGAEIADKAYSKTQLDAGQLDNRYYTETEIDTLDSTTVKLTGNQTITGVKTFSSNIVGNITGNSATATTLAGLTATVDELNYVDGVTSNIQTQLAGKLGTTATAAAATKLATSRTINGASFDGTADITAPTNLGITAGTTAGPIVTSSSGTNATLPTASATASGVVTTGAQTWAGVKTFSSSPIVPTPITDTQAANKKYVDSIISNIQTLPIGAILNGYTIFDNCIVAFGGEFNKADYPKLWAYIQANPTLVKTEAQWQTEATANGGICGYFSSGNGTTTFRVPNLDKAFLRPDSRSVGSYQADKFKSHSHLETRTGGLGSGTFDCFPITSGGANNLPWNTSTLNTGEDETIPKNIAVLPLIVAK